MVSDTIKKAYPKKYLGQNYLIDENICRNIVKAFDVRPEDKVIEIGPGKGALTKYLINMTPHFIAVELDKNNCEILTNEFPGLNLINKDFLSLNLTDVHKKYFGHRTGTQEHSLRIIGNIPYSITSGILFKLVDEREMIRDAQLMVQEEVARRITASPNTKDYGILSVQLQVFTKPELLFKVSKNCFSPKPKVDSRVIKFDFTNNLESQIHDIEFFRKFVRAAFSTRRKTLHNSLKNMDIDTNKFEINFDFSRRAESLEISEFIELSNYICNVKSQC